MNIRLKTLSAALLGAGVIAAGSASAFDLPQWLKGDRQVAAADATANSTKTAPAAPVPARSDVPNYRAIVEQAGPAVVGVTVSGMHEASEAQMRLPPGAENDPFFQFFRGLPGFGAPQEAPTPFRGQGSGFIISGDGLILTNAHVVREAKEVTVKLSDRREFAAKVVGLDPVTDVAVLDIDAKDLPTVQLGDPKELKVGDPVLAIGSPFGFDQSATQGIVSAKGRSLPGDSVVPFIQTDAAVNPGNSGGPLFNGDGEVVGINAQIYSRSGGFQGLSFAIPIDVALKVKDQIVATGHAQHARLGVTVQDVTQDLATSFGLKRPDGALVANVAPGSAAAKAGLKPGDVITELNGQPIVRSGELSTRIGMSAPGDKVALTVWRDRKSQELAATLGSTGEDAQTTAAGSFEAQKGQLGLALRPLTPPERAQLPDVAADAGLVIERVTGPAQRAGIQRGDVLLAINGKPVDGIEDVREVLKGKPGSVALLVERGGERIFVPVNLG